RSFETLHYETVDKLIAVQRAALYVEQAFTAAILPYAMNPATAANNSFKSVMVACQGNSEADFANALGRDWFNHLGNQWTLAKAKKFVSSVAAIPFVVAPGTIPIAPTFVSTTTSPLPAPIAPSQPAPVAVSPRPDLRKLIVVGALDPKISAEQENCKA